MKVYECTFTARRKGAIGASYPQREKLLAESEEAARLKLYDRYDHLVGFKVVSVSEPAYQGPVVYTRGKEPVVPPKEEEKKR